MKRRRRWRALAVILAVGILVPIAWRFDLLGVRSLSPFASVASAFDPPPGHPGYSWDRDGKPFGREELVTAVGPDHCRWGSATLLTIGWPPGSAASFVSGARIYIRDPNGVIGASYRELLELHATVPSAGHGWTRCGYAPDACTERT